jgi:tetratricopeptide (TPR) repeat protein
MFKHVIAIIVVTSLVSYLLMTSYLERGYKKLQTLDSARKLKYAAYISFYLLLVNLIIITTDLIVATIKITSIEQLSVKHFINLGYISLVILLIVIVSIIRDELKRYKWYRAYSPSIILSNSFIQKYNESLKSHNFEQARNCLIKACEYAPNCVMPWSALGYFYQLFFNDEQQSNVCMNNAKSILDSSQEPNKKDTSCYEYFLGNILYNRGQKEEGLEHLRKAVELNPESGWMEVYNEKLAEMKQLNPSPQNQKRKTP